MIDFTTTRKATVVLPTKVHPGRCPHCKGPIVGGRARTYCCTRCRRTAAGDRQRERNRLLSAKEKKPIHAAQKRWRNSAKGRKKRLEYKRKGRLGGTQGHTSRKRYLQVMRRTNKKRRKKLRKYMHECQTKYAGTGILPICVVCGAEVPYNDRGRPRAKCPTHYGKVRIRKKRAI